MYRLYDIKHESPQSEAVRKNIYTWRILASLYERMLRHEGFFELSCSQAHKQQEHVRGRNKRRAQGKKGDHAKPRNNIPCSKIAEPERIYPGNKRKGKDKEIQDNKKRREGN